MSALLTPYFERYAEEAITKMKAGVLAVSYYQRILTRLLKQEDLSGELAIIARVGPVATLAVVKEAIADYQAQVASAWQLNPRLQDMGKQKVSLARDALEHLPRADVSYQFKSAAGTVKVHITTAGETFKLDITAGRNPMAAQLACIELEKQLTFMALTG